MKSDIKLLLGIILSSVFVIAGFIFLNNKAASETIPNVDVAGVEANPGYYDLADVPIKGGIVSKEYKIKNITDKVIKIKKVATSCMCTKAKIKTSRKETGFFGMEGHGDRNPSVNLELAPGEEAFVIVNFDPAAHGPSGVGPFDRTVWLTFSDPGGVKELRFSGKVIS